jgi:hypothetical protein
MQGTLPLRVRCIVHYYPLFGNGLKTRFAGIKYEKEGRGKVVERHLNAKKGGNTRFPPLRCDAEVILE